MNDFFRFPHTPHVTWLGEDKPREDKVMTPQEQQKLLAQEVIVEEKVDGANLGLSLDDHGELQAQNRGQYLEIPYRSQFKRLQAWTNQHRDALLTQLQPNIIVFGEWCAARHSLEYRQLPDWYLVFDIYDRTKIEFWSASRRNKWTAETGLTTVRQILKHKTTLDDLKAIVLDQPSQYRAGKLEGIVVRSDDQRINLSRGKIVHPSFTQAIDTHWRSRTIEWNQVA